MEDGLSRTVAGDKPVNPAGAAPAGLTPRSLVQLGYLPVPPDLAPFVTTFFMFRSEESVVRDVQAATLGQLQFYLTGRGTLHFPDGRRESSYQVTLASPLSVARPTEIDGPIHMFGAALGPLGWGALTGLDAKQAADNLFCAEEMFGPEIAALGEQVRAAYAADPDGDQAALVEPVADFIRKRLKPVPDQHVAVVQAVVGWLGSGFNPPVADLYARTNISPRQVQRLVGRYFGGSPAHVARKYRAVRVAALLNQPDVSEETVAMLVDHFYDQPHMIREIREFVGRTPARFADGGAPILEAIVTVRNFVQIKPIVAPLPAEAPAEVANGQPDA